ncbi:hypothetical protein [Sediminibacterium sp.]|uniref:Y-family DNA polymerase n=1 Tax=Sediminibacterium sp. TaxID=1917865 RepID=UPI002719E5B1|nr:hypothetical protein [Sediminibacterium sp.]MDO9000522.1 hypothetical protein [Bacteroidota bacterium]MDP3146910.1 hypothetical protein [Bacteroidota bacterium]MDP3567551.1 hypothetical protein [Sediminibacterium sp.]
MQRQIAALDLDSFFVSVERLRNRAYIGKPLIIGGTSNHGVISSYSYEARAYGLRSAMPIKQANYFTRKTWVYILRQTRMGKENILK